MSSAKTWTSPPNSLARMGPGEVPFLDPSVICRRRLVSPPSGVVDSLRAGTIFREKARELGALTLVLNVEVTGMVVENGRITAVETTGGTIEAQTVVIACGVWSPKLARMAGAHIPLTPGPPDDLRRPVHQPPRSPGRSPSHRPRHGHLLL